MIGIIPAAGLGTRLQKITKGGPKELIPIHGKPMILWAIDELEASGIEQIVIVINPSKDQIKNELIKLGKNLTVIYQPEPLGLADAIYCCKNLVSDSSFVLSLPDNIFISTSSPIPSLIATADLYKKDVIALAKITSDQASGFANCGHVTVKELTSEVFTVTNIGDKQPGCFSTHDKPWTWKLFARYVLQYSFFTQIEKYRKSYRNDTVTKELDDVPILKGLAQSYRLLGVPVSGRLFDVGNPVGLQAAELFFDRKENL